MKVNNAPSIPNQVDIINRYLLSPKPKASFLIIKVITKLKTSNNIKKILMTKEDIYKLLLRNYLQNKFSS